MGGTETVTEKGYDADMNVDLKGAFFAVQKALPLMQEGSSVIFNSSSLAEMARAGSSVYSASKAAVNSLVRVLSAELAPKGIQGERGKPRPRQYPRFTASWGCRPKNSRRFPVRFRVKSRSDGSATPLKLPKRSRFSPHPTRRLSSARTSRLTAG